MSDSNNSSQNERLWELFIFYIVYLFSCLKNNNEETLSADVSSGDIARAHDFYAPSSSVVDQFSVDQVSKKNGSIQVLVSH